MYLAPFALLQVTKLHIWGENYHMNIKALTHTDIYKIT